MISIDNLTGWLSDQWSNATETVATGISSFTGLVESGIDSAIDWTTNAATGAVDTVAATASGAVEAVTSGVSSAVDGAIDGATDWIGDLVPDGLLASLGLGGGGLLAALLGFKLLRGIMRRQRAAAEYATFKVPAAIYEKVQGILESAGVTVVDGETVEGWAVFSVPRYHLGPTKRILGGLGVQWEQVA